jgi:hypothetical protein
MWIYDWRGAIVSDDTVLHRSFAKCNYSGHLIKENPFDGRLQRRSPSVVTELSGLLE